MVWILTMKKQKQKKEGMKPEKQKIPMKMPMEKKKMMQKKGKKC